MKDLDAMTLDELETEVDRTWPPYTWREQSPANIAARAAFPRLAAVVRAVEKHVAAREAQNFDAARDAYVEMLATIEALGMHTGRQSPSRRR